MYIEVAIKKSRAPCHILFLLSIGRHNRFQLYPNDMQAYQKAKIHLLMPINSAI